MFLARDTDMRKAMVHINILAEVVWFDVSLWVQFYLDRPSATTMDGKHNWLTRSLEVCAYTIFSILNLSLFQANLTHHNVVISR